METLKLFGWGTLYLVISILSLACIVSIVMIVVGAATLVHFAILGVGFVSFVVTLIFVLRQFG